VASESFMSGIETLTNIFMCGRSRGAEKSNNNEIWTFLLKSEPSALLSALS